MKEQKKNKDDHILIRINKEKKEDYELALTTLSKKTMSKDLTEHIDNTIEEAEEFKQGNIVVTKKQIKT